MVKRDEVFEAGMQVRREMFGAGSADAKLASTNGLDRQLEEMVTGYCFGETWTRPGLDRRTRSLLTIALLAAQGRSAPLKNHVRGAVANGATAEEIRETLLHTMIYAGVPAAVEGIRDAGEVLRELGIEPPA